MKPHVLYAGGVTLDLRIPFIEAMRDRGFRVTAAGSGDAAPFARAGIDFLPFPFDRFISPLSDWRAFRRLTEILDEVRPDLAQGFDSKPCLLLPLAARSGRRTRVIRTICGRAWVYSSSSPLALAGRPVYRLAHRLAARGTAATVFQIDSDRIFFERRRMAGRNGVLIPAGGGGVDVDRFERALAEAPSRGEMRAQLGFEPADQVVVTVSRLTRHKGIPSLLKAAASVHAERPGVKFLLVGPRESEGPLAVAQEDIDRHAPYVRWIGPRRDIPALLRMADLFVFPTEYAEGVPRVLLEAAVAGLPIVSTSMPGCCEVIHDGWSGRLVPPRAPERLARKIVEALESGEAAGAMAARCGARVRERFSVRAMAEQHDALYRAALDGGAVLPALTGPGAEAAA